MFIWHAYSGDKMTGEHIDLYHANRILHTWKYFYRSGQVTPSSALRNPHTARKQGVKLASQKYIVWNCYKKVKGLDIALYNEGGTITKHCLSILSFIRYGGDVTPSGSCNHDPYGLIMDSYGGGTELLSYGL